MIRVNLLAERRVYKQRGPFLTAHKVPVGCALLLVIAGALVGLRFLSLRSASAALDKDLAGAQRDIASLKTIIAQVQQFEQRKTELQQRVSLIEQLRLEQTGPVHMLDQISIALPPLLWLTGLKQAPGASEVLIDGRGMTMTSLSDFVANLESSGYFRRSVEIVSTTTEASPSGELIKFQIKATFQPPNHNLAPAGAEPKAHGA